MPNPQSPQITITERQAAVVSIEGVATDVAAFVGETSRGPISTPVLIGSLEQYVRLFGAAYTGSYMYEAVRGFFENGGARCYIVRVGHYTTISTPSSLDAVKGYVTMVNSTPTNTLTCRSSWAGTKSSNYGAICTRRDTVIGASAEATGTGARTSLLLTATTAARCFVGAQLKVVDGASDTIRFIVTEINGNTVYFASLTPAADVATAAVVTLETFDLTMYESGSQVATYTDLCMSSLAGARYVEALNNADNPEVFFEFDELGVAATASVDPRPITNTVIQSFGSGSDGTSVVDADIVGDSAGRNGLYALDGKEFNILAVPGETSATVAVGIQTYVALRKTIMAILEPPAASTAATAVTWLETTTNVAGDGLAVYWPWIKVPNRRTNAGLLTCPPSGHIAGVYARAAREVNLAHSPAGESVGRLQGVLDLETRLYLGHTDYDTLYPKRINAILVLPGSGIAIMGDRTLGSAADLRSVNKRRVQNFVIRSVEKSTRWILFEANDTETRARWRRSVEGFLLNCWRDKLLDGDSASEAFYVICNEDNNPATLRRAGKFKGRVGLNHKNSIGFADYEFEEDTRQIEAELAAAGL